MRIIDKALLTAALLTALILGGTARAVEQGDAAPPWHALDFAGKTVDFPDVAAGKPTVVVFWATWCPYCKAFMPRLKAIEADYRARGVKVIAINAKEDGRGDPKGYVQSLGFAPIAVANGDAIAKDYGIKFIPGLLIVDGAGQVAYRRQSTDLPAGTTVAQLWDGQVRTALDELLKH
jgi:thiol-disulfide isomerase/thioredoxin